MSYQYMNHLLDELYDSLQFADTSQDRAEIKKLIEQTKERKYINMHTVIFINGNQEIDCYGSLEENSNFEVLCAEEEDDSVWTDSNPNKNEPFKTWQEVAETLQPYFESDIIEISAV